LQAAWLRLAIGRLIAIGNTALWLMAAYALARIGAVFCCSIPLRRWRFARRFARRFRLVAVLGDGPAAQLGTIQLLQPQPAWLDPGPARGRPAAARRWRRRTDDDLPVVGDDRAPKAMFRTHRDHAGVQSG